MKKKLGKGLGALLENAQLAVDLNTYENNEDLESLQSVTHIEASATQSKLKELPVEYIQPGRFQPRRDISLESLEELAASIHQQGVMQPIVVRPIGQDRYEIIAGERRWRACQLAQLSTVPVIIKNVSDEATVAMALIENIQREDLNPMEQAVALNRLKEEFNLTQQEVGEAVGKSRTTITNLLRLNNLLPELKRYLEHGDIEMGHAKALLGLNNLEYQVEAARKVVAQNLSVRQTEALVHKYNQEKKTEDRSKQKQEDPNTLKLEEELSQRVGASVSIHQSKRGRGKLVISYSSLDELDGILAHIN